MKNSLPTYLFCNFLQGKLLVILAVFLSTSAFAQTKKPAVTSTNPVIVSYEVLDNGDTINRLDSRNQKQGRWLIVNKGGFGEADFMEYGVFADNIKSGVWKTYDMEGVLIAEEFFRKGIKDGEARYYEDGYLYCVGNYLALRSKYEYDTIMVEDPVTNLFYPVVIKSDVGTVRHGFWTFYDPPSTQIKKVIEYQADEVIYEKEYFAKADSTYLKAKMKSLPHVSNEKHSDIWIQEKGRKPAKFTDFPENTEYVKPNTKKSRK